MGKVLNRQETEKLFEKLGQEYDIYGPKVFEGNGCFSDTDVIRYGKLETMEELVWDRKSDYSFKEILFPVSETILYFTEDEMKVADRKPKKNLIFLRSCDKHALKRLDDIYLHNGAEDIYYKRMRENTVFAVMGCEKSFDSCFCASMGTNRCENYDLYVHPDQNDKFYFECGEHISESSSLRTAFGDLGTETRQEKKFQSHNKEEVQIPEKFPADIAKDPLWDEYTSRCIGCGRCNFVCPTCTCFTMQDIFYKDNPKAGERRRVWASCQIDGYSDIAGGHSFRQEQGERMRFKVLHKISDHKKRFGYNMCVGCGRCEQVCPEYISYIACLGKLKSREVE